MECVYDSRGVRGVDIAQKKKKIAEFVFDCAIECQGTCFLPRMENTYSPALDNMIVPAICFFPKVHFPFVSLRIEL